VETVDPEASVLPKRLVILMKQLMSLTPVAAELLSTTDTSTLVGLAAGLSRIR
jgi:hypothetical protein